MFDEQNISDYGQTSQDPEAQNPQVAELLAKIKAGGTAAPVSAPATQQDPREAANRQKLQDMLAVTPQDILNRRLGFDPESVEKRNAGKNPKLHAAGRTAGNILMALLGRNFGDETQREFAGQRKIVDQMQAGQRNDELDSYRTELNRRNQADLERKTTEGSGRLVSTLEKDGTRRRVSINDPIPEGWKVVGEDILGDPSKQTISNERAGKVLVTKELASAAKGLLKEGDWVDKATADLAKFYSKPTSSTAGGRPLAPLARMDAIFEQEVRGKVFKDGDGNVIDANKLSPTQVIIQTSGNGPATIVTQAPRFFTANNKRQVGGINTLYGDSGTGERVLGNAQVDKFTVPAGFESDGTYRPGQTSYGSGSVTPSPAAKDPHVPASPATNPVVGSQPPAQPGVPAAPAIPSGPKPGRWSGAQYQKSREAYRPLHLLGSMVFGSDENPNSKPLSAYADIFDDPAARQRVANAIKVVMANKDSISIGSSSDFDSFNKGGHLGSGTLVPVSVGGSLSSSSGSNRGGKSLNIPAVMKANQDFYKVLDELKPGKEREYLSLALSTMESAPGMKQATQGPNASSAMANIKNIQASLFPIAGISGIVSSTDYRRQLKRVANEILQYEKTAITPIDPKLKERLVKYLGEAEGPATRTPAATDDALSRFNKLF